MWDCYAQKYSVILTLRVFVKPVERKLELFVRKSIKAFLEIIFRSLLKPALFAFINSADAFVLYDLQYLLIFNDILTENQTHGFGVLLLTSILFDLLFNIYCRQSCSLNVMALPTLTRKKCF